MICFVALFVFGVLSLFSAKYRPFFRASIDCVFRRLTFRPCNTTLEEQVKSETVAAILPKSAAAAKFINTYWEAISWAFTILMFASLIYSAYSVYNLITIGTCEPSGACIITGCDSSKVIMPSSLAGYYAGNQSAKVTVVQFGDYACPYTRSAEGGVQELLLKDGSRINYVFKPAPLQKIHANANEAALAAICANQSGKYWDYRKWLFENQADFPGAERQFFTDGAKTVGMDGKKFSDCLSSPSASSTLDSEISEANQSGVCLTPVFFVNGKKMIGQWQYSQLKGAVDDAYANIK